MGNPLEGVDCDVALSASPSIATTNEAMNDSGDHITYLASIHTHWDQTQPFTVQTSPNGSSGWTTVTDYVMQWAIGKVVFNTARVPGTNAFVRISAGSYFNVTQVDETRGWSLSLKANTTNTTVFQSPGAWARNTATTKSGSGKLDTFRTDDRIFKEIGNLAVMQLWIDKSANIRWEFYAWITGVDPKADATDMVEQAVGFDVEGPAYYLAS
jgi:hypothetical protein